MVLSGSCWFLVAVSGYWWLLLVILVSFASFCLFLVLSSLWGVLGYFGILWYMLILWGYLGVLFGTLGLL